MYMEAYTMSALTEALLNILLGTFSIAVLSWAAVAVDVLIGDLKRGKREEEAAKRDAEYHEKRMKE